MYKMASKIVSPTMSWHEEEIASFFDSKSEEERPLCYVGPNIEIFDLAVAERYLNEFEDGKPGEDAVKSLDGLSRHVERQIRANDPQHRDAVTKERQIAVFNEYIQNFQLDKLFHSIRAAYGTRRAAFEILLGHPLAACFLSRSGEVTVRPKKRSPCAKTIIRRGRIADRERTPFVGRKQIGSQSGSKSESDTDSEPTVVATVNGLDRRTKQTTLENCVRSGKRGNSSGRETEDADEDGQRKRACMPKTLGQYYHTVVYFERSESSGNRSRTWKRKHLQELADKLADFYAKNRKSLKRNALVVTHFYGRQDKALEYAYNEQVYVEGVRSTSRGPDPGDDDPDDVEPHVHIVYWVATGRKDTGIDRIVGEWRRLQSIRSIDSAKRVGCYDCLRKYLRKGQGRVVRIEIVSNTLGQERSNHQDIHDISDGSRILCRDDDREAYFSELEGKRFCYNSDLRV